MPDLFQYEDYRKFLGDYYQEMKAGKPGFSYKVLAQKAGFANKGFAFNIIKGKKALSKANILKLCTALKLSKRESEYFENLVCVNQARTHEEQSHYYGKLLAVKMAGNGSGRAQVLRRDQYEFYSRWHHAAVRSLIDMQGYDGDYKAIGKKLRPTISAREARKSVELLLRLGLLVKTADNGYKAASKTITTGPEAPRPAVINFHGQTLKLAEAALKELPKEKRNISGLTLGISEKGYDDICEEIVAFRKRLLEIAEKDEKADRVYQLNFHLFPMTNTFRKGI